MSKRTSVIVDYTQGNIFRQMITFAVPFMLSALLQVAYSLVDSIVVGQYVGSAGLAGVNTSAQITSFTSWVVLAFASAGQVIISQRIGAKDMEGVRKTLGTLFTITILMALALMVVCLTLCNPLLRLLNTPEEAFGQARSYMLVCSLGFVFVCGYNAGTAILRGSGDSKRPFIIIAVASVTNLVLDLLFVAVFNMEAAGAAWATVISQFISMVLCVRIFYRNREDYHFTFTWKNFAIDPEAFSLLMRMGIPLALKSSAINISNLFVNSFVNSYGVAASAAIAVGGKLQQLPSIITQGLYNAGTAMIGQNLGARQYDRIRRIVRIMLYVCIVTFAVFSALIVLFPQLFFRIFTTDAEVLAYAKAFAWILVVNSVGSAIMCPYYSVVIGIGHANFNLAISLLDGIVLRIGLSFLFGQALHMGVTGFYLGSCLAVLGTSIPSLIYYLTGRWQTYSIDKKKKTAAD